MTGVQYIQNTKGLILIDFSIIMTVFILYLIIYSVSSQRMYSNWMRVMLGKKLLLSYFETGMILFG